MSAKGAGRSGADNHSHDAVPGRGACGSGLHGHNNGAVSAKGAGRSGPDNHNHDGKKVKGAGWSGLREGDCAGRTRASCSPTAQAAGAQGPGLCGCMGRSMGVCVCARAGDGGARAQGGVPVACIQGGGLPRGRRS